MKGTKLLSLSIAVGLGLASQTAMALPDSTKGNPLDLLGIITPDSVGDIVPDHKDENTLHVGPASIKEVQGHYSALGGTGPQCIDFANIQRQAYLMPVTSTQKEQAFLDRDYVSNYFQLTYAIPRANVDGLNDIKDAREEVRRAGAENQALVANYLALKQEWTDLTVAISVAKEALDKINDTYDDEKDLLRDAKSNSITTCSTAFAIDQDVNKFITCVNTANTTYDNAVAALNAKLASDKAPHEAELAVKEPRKAAISQDYYAAKGAYEAFDIELDLLKDDVAFHSLIIKAQMDLTADAWDIEKDVLNEEKGKVVGRASAGYTLFANEHIDLANVLAANNQHQYTVKKLDVFNIRMNAGVTVDNITTETDNGATIFNKNVWSFPADTLMSSNILADWAMPFEREERSSTIHFDTMDETSFGSGGFDFYVTKGARCAQYEQVVEETFTANTSGGIETSWKVTNRYSEPAPNQTVFSQAVGLSYNYYAYPGPIRGECSIEVDRMSSYWRNAGKKSSWSWFRKKNTSWDNTRQTVKNDMGMECKLDLAPEGGTFEESKQLAEAFERAMYDDMWQMFLAVYAKEYTVEVLEPETPDLEKSTVGASLGNGLISACPANVWCQFGGIVLKTLDEIGGSKAQGTTSAVNYEYGKIWKTYDKDTFTLRQGNSLVNVRVCVDSNQCN